MSTSPHTKLFTQVDRTRRSRSRQAGEWRLRSTSWPWRSDSETSTRGTEIQKL